MVGRRRLREHRQHELVQKDLGNGLREHLRGRPELEETERREEGGVLKRRVLQNRLVRREELELQEATTVLLGRQLLRPHHA